VNLKTKIGFHPSPAKHKSFTTTPYRKIKVDTSIRHVLPLPGEQRVITYAWDGSFRVWHLERSTQVGEEWEDKDESVKAMALSLDGKMVASGEFGWCSEIMEHRHGQGHQRMDGAYGVRCICWSLDGERVVSGSSDGPFRVRDIKSDTTLIRPIKAGEWMNTVCYSPDDKTIATSGEMLKIDFGMPTRANCSKH